jgi:cobalt-zinc-cadmium efflux system outer membrane protein
LRGAAESPTILDANEAMLKPTWDREPVFRRGSRARRVLRFALSFALLGRPLLSRHAEAAEQPAQSSEPATLSPGDYRNETRLVDLLWTRAPDVLDARSSLGSAASDLLRSETLPNPAFDFTWGTVPVGPTNPVDLQEPLTSVPNYSFGVSELLEIGKRGVRQDAASADLERTRAQAFATLSGKFFELLDSIGRIAHAQMRVATYDTLVKASDDLLSLDRARASKGESALVDVDRSEVEHVRLLAHRDSAAAELDEARAQCAALIAAECPEFASAHDAGEFLGQESHADLPRDWSSDIEQRRSDIEALGAGVRAAQKKQDLARRRAIPDVTVRVGYLYDTFVAAGNQRNSLSLGVQLPLPVFDRGQADFQAASATRSQYAGERRALLDASRLALDSAVRQRDLVATRSHRLDEALAKARSVRDTIEATARRGGGSMADILLARRSYQELLLEREDLDLEAFSAALKVRAAAGLVPMPSAIKDSNS